MLITQSDRNFYNANKDNYNYIISIVCPDEKELVEPIHNNHIIIKMWDIDKKLENKFRTYEPPAGTDVRALMSQATLMYYDSLRNNKEFKLLVHCDAGLSRSSAIVLGILWEFSEFIFSSNVDDDWLRPYLDARKQWCKSILDWDNSVPLCRYIDGRFNPGIKPNLAILEYFRNNYNYFPW